MVCLKYKNLFKNKLTHVKILLAIHKITPNMKITLKYFLVALERIKKKSQKHIALAN